MKSKKAWIPTGNMLVGLIIAALCLFSLFAVFAAFYLKNSNTNELNQAKATLEGLMQSIDTGKPSFVVNNPEDWEITSWPNSQGELPDNCVVDNYKSCICICKNQKSRWNILYECNAASACEYSEGFSLAGGKRYIMIKDLKDRTALTLNINYKDKTISA